MEIKTKGGFTCEIDEKVFRDFRFVRALRDTGADDAATRQDASFALEAMLFPEREAEDALFAFLADEQGHVSTDAVFGVIGEIISEVAAKDKAAKKS